MASKRPDTRHRLFAAAAELIGERGFHGTTVDDIVERAGVAKGTVYYHFKSKAELFDGLLSEHFSALGDAFRATAASASSPDQALRALVHTELLYIHENQAASKLLMSELWRADRAWSETLRVLRDRYGTVIAGVLADGVASGEFRSDLDTTLAATVLFGTVATAALDWLVFQPARPREEVEAAVAEIVMRAVRA